MSDATAKAGFVEAYFDRWGDDVDRAKTLLLTREYYREAILVLSCHIGALASLRFPALADGVAYKRMVLEYSGMSDFYERIDLLFFLQWPRSELSTHGDFLKLKHHRELATAIEAAFGNEDTVREAAARYVSPPDFLAAVETRALPGFDRSNLQEFLALFSNVELLYRYVRCRAVHSLRFPFVTTVHLSDGGVRYESNHAITGDVLHQTVLCVLRRLRAECLREKKWPWEL
jgi:hypothetical protein